jgi:hypothetical protein
MKIIANTKLINRNKKIGQYTTFGSLAILVGGLILSLNPSADPNMLFLSFGALIVGFLLSQVGIYFGNRFGRSPRPDERITASLKGLDDRYALYHYLTPVAHLLVGPAGIWILNPYSQKGNFIYDPVKKKWNQQGGNVIMKLFGQEGLGRPDQENYALYQDFTKFLKKEAEVPGLPEPQVAMVFLNPQSSIQAAEAPVPALAVDKLKDFLRKQAKENASYMDTITVFQNMLPAESTE